MSDRSDVLRIVEIIPSVQGSVSAIASGVAPFIYFENAPFCGLLNGIGQVTLEANRLMGADAKGLLITDRVIVAHLRGNIQAMKALRAALDGMILLAEPVAPGPAN